MDEISICTVRMFSVQTFDFKISLVFSLNGNHLSKTRAAINRKAADIDLHHLEQWFFITHTGQTVIDFKVEILRERTKVHIVVLPYFVNFLLFCHGRDSSYPSLFKVTV